MLQIEKSQCDGDPPLMWVARVPSKSNMPTTPAGGLLEALEGLMHLVVHPQCPLTGRELGSFFARG